jgi:Zn-finger nucleic acid-binding protein/ribosomal protein L40E
MRHLVSCELCRTQYDVTRATQRALRCRCGHLITLTARAPVLRPIARCGFCGGPMAADARRCEFCDGEVVRDARQLTLICPECLAQNPSRSLFCRSCGVAISPEPAGGARKSRLRCPRCEAGLFGRRISDLPVHECAGCHGVWIRAAHFGQLLRRVVEERVEAGTARAPELDRAAGALNVKYLFCPDCREPMHRKIFERVSGVLVDQCPKDGVWLDAHELEAIAHFLAQGGLAKARLAGVRPRHLADAIREPESKRRGDGTALVRGFLSLLR